METIRRCVDEPFLWATSKLMTAIYHTTGFSPVVQRVSMDFVTGISDALVGFSLCMVWMNQFESEQMNTSVFVFGGMMALMNGIISGVLNYAELRQAPKQYRASEYKQASARALRYKEKNLHFRILGVLFIPAFLFVLSVLTRHAALHGWGAILAVTLLVGTLAFPLKHFMAACEPPEPDDGDPFF